MFNKRLKKGTSMILALALLLGLVVIPKSAPVFAESLEGWDILLEKNSEWKYNDQGNDLGTVWQATYDDSSWSQGMAPFGYKDNGSMIATDKFGPLQTTTSYGSDKKMKPRTTYFRKNINVNAEQIQNYGQILGTFAIDDGAVLYVNGKEVTRFGMPDGPIDFYTKAISSKDLPVIYSDIDLTNSLKALLRDGDNEIGVEVHQQSDGSSDLYFDMRLDAHEDAPPVPTTEVTKVTVTFKGDPKTAKGFTWFTPKQSVNSDLQVVPKGSDLPDFNSAMKFVGRSESAKYSDEISHKAEATGLQPKTSYYYRVGDESLNIWSEVGVFTTAPENGAFTFVDLSDTQAQNEEEAALSAATISKAMQTVPEAEFFMLNGDIVERGSNEQEWDWLLGFSQNSLLNTTIAPATGNHEKEKYSFNQHFNILSPPGSSTETGEYYSYDYSNAHFIVLNTNENSSDFRNFSPEQVAWLKEDVRQAKAAGAKWIIVNLHKGPYTTASHATDSDIMGPGGERTTIAPLMNELGIDLVLQGHDHIYARSKPILADGTAENVEKITETYQGHTIEYAVKPNGTIYYIPSTAGAKVYSKNKSSLLGDNYFNLFERAEENHAFKNGSLQRGLVQNFASITIDGDKLSALTYEIDQSINNATPFIVDQFGITKQDEPDYSNEKISKITATFYGDTKSSKGFTWYTSTKLTDSTVQITKQTDSEPDFSKATIFTGSSAPSSNSRDELVHKAVATGLEANTTYYYRVGDKERGVWSDVGTIQTSAASGAFTFIDLADTQAKTSDEAELSAQTLEKALQTVKDAQFVVHNGDLVDKGTKEEQWDWLLGFSQKSLLNTTFVPSAGNHEDENFAFYEHFNINEPKGSATETGAYYSYDYNNAHFIVLNSNEDSEKYANFSEEQVEWLKKDAIAAKRAGAKWIFVNIHKGPYTTSNHATDSDIMGANGVRQQIAPLMAELDIDFVMQGHDHIYARTKPITKDGKATSPTKIKESLHGETIEYSVNPDGSIYVIPATAGPKVYYKNPSDKLGESYYNLFDRAEENHAAIYGPDPSDNRRPKRSQVQNFMGITIDGNKFTAVTYEIDQNKNDAKPFIVDQFGIIKKDSEPSTPGPGTGTDNGSNPNTPGSGSSGGNSSGGGSNTGSGNTNGNNSGSNNNNSGTNSSNNGNTTGNGSSSTGNEGTGTTPVLLKDISGHWAESAIQAGITAGYISGYSDQSFKPNATINRAEFITMLGRALGMNNQVNNLTFKDVKNIPAWAKPYVSSAIEAGIVSGYADGTFRADKQLNRAEVTTWMVRAAGLKVNANASLSFSDRKSIPAWAVPYVATAVKEGLVGGVGQNRFAPQQIATRGEAAAFIAKLLKVKA